MGWSHHRTTPGRTAHSNDRGGRQDLERRGLGRGQHAPNLWRRRLTTDTSTKSSPTRMDYSPLRGRQFATTLSRPLSKRTRCGVCTPPGRNDPTGCDDTARFDDGENPAYARILLNRDESSPTLEQLHRNAFHRAVDLVVGVAGPRLEPGFDEEGLKMDAVAGIGGFLELLRAWQSGYLEVDARRIVEHTGSSAARYRGRHHGPLTAEVALPPPPNAAQLMQRWSPVERR